VHNGGKPPPVKAGVVMSIQLEFPVTLRQQTDVIRDLSDYGIPQAPSRAVAQSTDRALRSTAVARLKSAALHREEWAKLSPEQVADRRTSLADARIALCIAQGNSLDDIDPASGYSLSRTSYERTRQSWRNQAKQPGWSESLRPALEKALVYWTEHRPEFTAGDDWFGDLVNSTPNNA